VWAKREDEWVGWDVEARPGLTQRGKLKNFFFNPPVLIGFR
jgi:hypothetical protein